VADARSKLLIAPLVLRPAANVDVTGTTNVRDRTPTCIYGEQRGI